MEGVEPSSKRGNHKLSTCLSSPNFSNTARPKPPTSTLSSLVSPEPQGRTQAISDITAPLSRNASEQQQPSDVSSPHLVQRLSLIYYNSIKQQERNYFRQIKF